MSFFKKIAKEDRKGTVSTNLVQQTGNNVLVLGGGCAKCNELEKHVKMALQELAMEDVIEHVTDFGQIAAMGVMSTPALVIDNKVVSMGKVLSKDEVVKIIRKVREE